ncbi:hypothetical protein [Ornithinibacillus scapharcae]|uniref:hypothetical protein n=1 Tax=Ornithinibacillus scapharcae TaxID=1147159 RepID=UPI0002F7B19B|nr:hypothetical protein [Ornithinibacillus scapharcae]
MYLFVSILICSVLAIILFLLGPVVGGIIGFGIVLGVLFRVLYLLNDIHKRISNLLPKRDKVEEAFRAYLEKTN